MNVILLGAVSTFYITELTDYMDQRNFLTGDWYNDSPHYWVDKQDLQEKSQNYTDVSDQSHVRYYFQPYQGVYLWIPDSKQPEAV